MRITWGLHIEMSEAKGCRAFIKTYFLFRSGHLSTSIKLTLQADRIRSVMTYACPDWELAADTHLLKLQRVQNKVFLIIGNYRRSTPVRDLYTVFKFPYIHDYKTKFCRQQAEHVRSVGQGEARHRK
jgi:hypothetical protein